MCINIYIYIYILILIYTYIHIHRSWPEVSLSWLQDDAIAEALKWILVVATSG